jgi:O-antigen ligase
MSLKKIPYLFVLLLVFTVPWQMVVSFPEFGTISRAIGYVAVGVAALYILINRKIKEPPLVIFIMLLFIIWSLLSYFWGIRPQGAISRFVTNMQLLAMVWLIWELINTKKEAASCLQVFVFGSYVAIVDMLLSYYTNQFTTFRIAATGFDPNYLAISLAIGIPIAWYLLATGRNNLLFYINLLYIPLTIFCIILTASRGGLVVAFVGLMIIPSTLLLMEKTKRGIVVAGFIIIGLIGIIEYPSIAANLKRNIDRLYMLSENIEQRDLGIRGRLIERGLQIFRENPVLGVGARGFADAVVEVGHGRAHTAHNTYLSVLVEFGIIGFILFIAIFVFSMIPNLHAFGIEKIFYLILFITLCIGIFPIRMEANKILWLMFAFLILENAFILRNNRLAIVKKPQ